MARYLVIESRDPYESQSVDQTYDLAAGLSRDGHEVTLLLVQNAVLSARKGARTAPLMGKVEKTSVKVMADDFALRQRGIDASRLAPGITATHLDLVIDELAAGAKAIWH